MSQAVATMKSKQVLALTLVAVGGLACLGFNAELCDIVGTCRSRFAFLVAAGVISTVITAVALVALLVPVAPLKPALPFLCAALAVWWGISAGVASSPRTYFNGILNIGMLSAWLAFVASLAAAVGSAAEAGWLSGQGGGSVEDEDEADKALSDRASADPEAREAEPVAIAEDV